MHLICKIVKCSNVICDFCVVLLLLLFFLPVLSIDEFLSRQHVVVIQSAVQQRNRFICTRKSICNELVPIQISAINHMLSCSCKCKCRSKLCEFDSIVTSRGILLTIAEGGRFAIAMDYGIETIPYRNCDAAGNHVWNKCNVMKWVRVRLSDRFQVHYAQWGEKKNKTSLIRAATKKDVKLSATSTARTIQNDITRSSFSKLSKEKEKKIVFTTLFHSCTIPETIHFESRKTQMATTILLYRLEVEENQPFVFKIDANKANDQMYFC